MNPVHEITPTLCALRRRIFARTFLRSAARATLFFYTLLVALTALATWMSAARPDLGSLPFTLVWPFVLGAIAGLATAFFNRPSLRCVAEIVDALGGTRDRLITAFDFSDIERASDMEILALRETVDFTKGKDFRPLLPIRPPEELRWLVVPLAVLAMLWSDGLRAAAEHDAHVTAATDSVAGTLKQIETLAELIAKNGVNDERASFLSERLKQSAVEIRAEAFQGGDAQKTALREMAKLEELVKELRRPENVTANEMQALSAALANHEPTKSAAKDITEGSLGSAAKKLVDLEKDEAAASQAQQAIQQALDHFAQKNQQLSHPLEKLRKQSQQGSDPQQLTQQLSEALSDMQKQSSLAQQQGNSQQQKGAQQMSDDDLKKLLGVLQRMKNQQQGDGQPQQADGEQQGDGQISMLSFGQRRKNDSEDSGQPQANTLPGSDKDKGSTETPFGKSSAANNDPDMRDSLSGRLAEGESLSAAIPAAGGDAKTARRYKELYNAAAADAEEAITQENIPLGSRLLIQRYFEAIRPKQ